MSVRSSIKPKGRATDAAAVSTNPVVVIVADAVFARPLANMQIDKPHPRRFSDRRNQCERERTIDKVK